jgi:hypothetical protein
MVKILYKKKDKRIKNYDVGAINSLQQHASKFIMCFIKFWVKLNKFTMVKVDNLLINGTNCYGQVNSLIIN